MNGIKAAILFAALVAVSAKECPIEDVLGQDVLYPHPDCDKFYQCSHGALVTQRCYTGLYYNTATRRCDWPGTVNCGKRNRVQPRVATTFNVEEEIELLKNGCPVDPTVHLLIGHEEDCNLFYACEDGEKMLKKCPPSLHFNPDSKVCDWQDNADCSNKTPKGYEHAGFFKNSIVNNKN